MFKEMGYEALFFARMADDLKSKLGETGDKEFIWNPKFEVTNVEQENIDEQQEEQGLFTHVFFNHYNSALPQV